MLKGVDINKPVEDFGALIDMVKSCSIEELYISALECQVKFCSIAVRESIRKIRIWHEAVSVLDAGCGPGAFVEEFKEFFEGKDYLGIDIEDGFVKSAKERFADTAGYKFEQCDILKYSDRKCDVVLLWAVLQHLDNTDVALSHLKEFANTGIVILDARQDTYEFVSNPLLPTLSRCYENLKREAGNKGRNADCIADAKKWASTNLWTVSYEELLKPRAETDLEKQNFFYYACFVSGLFERKYGMKIVYEDLVKELEDWRVTDNSYAENKGGQWLVLEKR